MDLPAHSGVNANKVFFLNYKYFAVPSLSTSLSTSLMSTESLMAIQSGTGYSKSSATGSRPWPQDLNIRIIF